MAQQSNNRVENGAVVSTVSNSAWGNIQTTTHDYTTDGFTYSHRFVAMVQPPNPDYPKKKLPQPYFWSKVTTTSGFGVNRSWDYTYRLAPVVRWSNVTRTGSVESSLAYGTPPSVDSTSVYNNALEKFYSKIRGEGSANLAVDAAELPKTLSLMKGYVQDLFSLRRKLLGTLSDPRKIAQARRQFRKWKKHHPWKLKLHLLDKVAVKTAFKNADDFAASEWLKFSLGLKPTIGTLDAISKLMPRAVDTVHRVTGSNQKLLSSTERWKNGNMVSVAEHDVLLNVRVTAYYAVGDSSAAMLHDVVPATPVSTIWELIPLSWVADYFVNVGQYLNLLDAAHARGLVYLAGYRRDYHQKVTLLNYGTDNSVLPNPIRGSITAVTGSYRSQSYSRTLINSFPRPGRPSVRLSLNGDKIANLGALLDQYVRRVTR